MTETTEMIDERRPEYGETGYRITIERIDYHGRVKKIASDERVWLKAAWLEVESEADKAGWFKDELS